MNALELGIGKTNSYPQNSTDLRGASPRQTNHLLYTFLLDETHVFPFAMPPAQWGATPLQSQGKSPTIHKV